MYYDNISIISTRLRSGKSTPDDLIFTGTGFLLMTDECPDCEHNRFKREKVGEENKEKSKAFWEKTGVEIVLKEE
jgi:hypothetical protein